MELYLDDPKSDRKPIRMANTKETMDRLVVHPDDPNKLLWWWCDALYMAPPVLSRVYLATGDKKYLDYMDRQWWLTSDLLFDKEEHLYFRDSRYLTQKQANGQKLFWSRGNGWVLGGLVKVLQIMPKDYPSRPKYVEQYKQMAARVAAIQGKDGLWRSGLLDPDAYELPEISGSAFFTYAIAYGINENILDRKTYLPVVEKSWKGMLSHIYADGRLGSIQPIDGQPGKFKPSSSYVFGVGGFLLAGSEMNRLAGKH
jgi:unsaturated rhamnogalacturonyl hydrolase